MAFGYQSAGASTEGLAGNFVCGFGPHAASSNANAIKVYGYLRCAGNATLGIYADSSGLPGALLGVTPEVVVNSAVTPIWIVGTLVTPVAISSGTSYWIGARFSSNFVAYYDAAGGFSIQYRSAAYSAGVLPDPFGTPGGSISNKKYSFWVEQAPRVGGPLLNAPPLTTLVNGGMA